jgi:hypothetical protein
MLLPISFARFPEHAHSLYPITVMQIQRYHGGRMKLPPPANLSEGGTPAERLDRAFRTVLTVPKEALLKEESKLKRQKEKRRAKKK